MRHLDVPACAEHRGEVGWARGRTHERILGLKRALRFVDSVLLWIMVTVLRYHAVQPRDRVTGAAVPFFPFGSAKLAFSSVASPRALFPASRLIARPVGLRMRGGACLHLLRMLRGDAAALLCCRPNGCQLVAWAGADQALSMLSCRLRPCAIWNCNAPMSATTWHSLQQQRKQVLQRMLHHCGLLIVGVAARRWHLLGE